MENIYIKTDELSLYIKNKYCKDKDIISLDYLLWIIDEQQDEIDRLEEEKEDLQNSLDGRDYDPEIEIPQIHGKGISW